MPRLLFFICISTFLFNSSTHAISLHELVVRRAKLKDPKKFTLFADSVSSGKLLDIDRTIQWDCHKDNSQFIGNYWQIGFRFSEMGIGRKDEYTDVYFFIVKDTAFYCEARNPVRSLPAGMYFQFTDTIRMENFSQAWKKTYGVGLKMSDFDSLDYNYGFHCGIDGVRLDGRLLLDEMVRQRDTVMLNQWLQSPLAGRQAYAVDGFYQLSKRGVWLSTQQKQRIKAVQARDAALNFCAGCNYSIKRLKDVTKSFIF